MENIIDVPVSIMEKIQKLYAKSMSSREIGSLAEAESFMLKVQKLLSEYNLEISMISDKSEKSSIGEDKISYKGLVSYGDWEVNLMTTICSYNWCECIYNSNDKTMTLIGRGDNIGVCKYLYNFISINLVVLSKKSYYNKLEELNNKLSEYYGYSFKDKLGKLFEEYLHKNKFMPYRRYYIRDYLAGAVIGINTKFSLQQSQQSQEFGMSGLILFNAEKIKDYMNEFHSDVIYYGNKEIKRGLGYSEGYMDGCNLKIGEALEFTKDCQIDI